MIKLYCFVDETGQDTKGAFFLVSIVLKERKNLEILEKKLLKIESSEKKSFVNWKKLSFEKKAALLKKLANLKELYGSIYYSAYQTSTIYTSLTALTIAKAVLNKQTGNQDYIVTVVIDGLNDKEREAVSHELKKLKIHYRKIRGMKDEQNIFLRLAHFFASILRDYKEKQRYAIAASKMFKGIINEV